MSGARSLLLGLWAGAALLSALIGLEGARLVEAAAALRAGGALGPAGHAWARMEADGLRLTLSGEAPSEAARAAALAAFQEAAASPLPGFASRVVDETTARAALPVFRPEPEAIIMRGLSEISVAGAAPGRLARAALSDALAAAAPGVALADLSRDDASGAAERWAEGAGQAAEIAAALLHGRVAFSPERLAFSGVASGPAEVARIEAAMAAAEGAGWAVEADLAALPVAAAAFTLHVETGPGGRGAMACSAASEAEAETLGARLSRLDPPGEAVCSAMPGAPAGWSAATSAGLDALATLPAGELRFTGLRARLTARPPTRRRALDAAAAALRGALPPGYALAVLSDGGMEPEREASQGPDHPPDSAAGALLVTRADGRLRIAGSAPDPLIGESLAAYARLMIPGAAIESSMSYGGEFDPGWRASAMTMIAATARLEAGEARLDPQAATLEGGVADPLEVAALHRLVAAGVGGERSVSTRLTISPAALAAREKMPPARCAERLTEIAAARPILFAPGEAGIDPAAEETIVALSEALDRCAGGRIEIGGHTDSQGSEAVNLALSAARAEAVLAALLKAGARLALLSAKGYGEAEPVADNATEAGRALNRRIAFRALEEQE